MKDILNFVPKAKLFLKDGKLMTLEIYWMKSWQKKRIKQKHLKLFNRRNL